MMGPVQLRAQNLLCHSASRVKKHSSGFNMFTLRRQCDFYVKLFSRLRYILRHQEEK